MVQVKQAKLRYAGHDRQSATENRQDVGEGRFHLSPDQRTVWTTRSLFNRLRRQLLGLDGACALIVKKGVIRRRFGRGER